MNITQRTDNRHAQAATMAAGVIPANLPDVKVDEYAMGMAMMRAARMEGTGGKRLQCKTEAAIGAIDD